MRTRRVALAALVPALLAGCSSSGGDSPASTAPASSAASGSTSGGSGTAAPSGPVAELVATLRKGLSGLTSAHLTVDAGALGGTSEGNVAYSDGKATGSDITVTSGKETTRIVTVGTTSYAKLPAGRNTSGKPWVKVTPGSTNEFVRALATSVDLSKAASSLPAVADIAATSATATKKGNTYSIEVEPAKAAGTGLGKLLGTIGQKEVPVKLTLDGKGRPTDVTITITIGSSALDVVIKVSKFDAPVKVAAPPASQVAS